MPASGTRLGLLMVLSLGPVAHAQVVPRVPPAPAPTPEFVPPAVVPPPVVPREPEVEAPKLVARDPQGALVQYPQGVELAAVSAFKVDAERRLKITQSLAVRNAELEGFVAANLDKVAAALEARASVESITDFNQLARAREAATPLRGESILDRLQRDGAISSAHRGTLDQAVAEYVTEQRREWEKQTGMDVMKIATVVGRQSFTDATRDAFLATDRLVQRAMVPLTSSDHGLTLSPEQSQGLTDIAAALAKRTREGNPPGDDAATAVVREFIFKTLTPEQRSALLARFVTPGPTP
jgi:hypothetical protein